VHQRASAVRFSSSLANISVYQRFKKQPYARSAPSIPPPFLPQSKPWGRKGAKRGQALGVGRQASGKQPKQPYALVWYVPRLVDDPGTISRARLFLESMAIPIAHNRFTYPTGCISVHQRASAVRFSSSLANISVYQRFKKQPYARSAPSSPPPFLPQPKPWGRKGAKRGEGL
jgi:hypothetical protein